MTVAPLIAMKSTKCESLEAVGKELDRRAHTYAKKAQRTVGDVMREATEAARATKALSCNHVAPTNSRQRGQAR